jgi:hypothetical protein
LNLKLSEYIGMSPGSVSYTSSVIVDLTDRTQNEVWLLEAIYDIAEQPIAASLGDGLIYPPDGSEPKVHGYATADYSRKRDVRQLGDVYQ